MCVCIYIYILALKYIGSTTSIVNSVYIYIYIYIYSDHVGGTGYGTVAPCLAGIWSWGVLFWHSCKCVYVFISLALSKIFQLIPYEEGAGNPRLCRIWRLRGGGLRNCDLGLGRIRV